MNEIENYINELFDNVGLEKASQKLESHKDGASKTKFLYEILKQKNVLPKLKSIRKDCSVSVDVRNKGNQFFKEKNYVAALECYNKSICFATSGSEELAVGYANRSAVYLNSGFYKFCQENIELALRGNYPEKLRIKLDQRAKECQKLMSDCQDSLEKCKKVPNLLSYHPNEKIPIMIDGLEYAKTEQFGRHIRAKRDLYPGVLLLSEEDPNES